MSKLTKREYRNIAKRAGKRGHGMSHKRKRPESDWKPREPGHRRPIKGNGMPQTRFESGKALQEAVRPDAEAEAATAEELLTDLGLQEAEMEAEAGEEVRAEEEVPKRGLENPLSFSGSSIDSKVSERS